MPSKIKIKVKVVDEDKNFKLNLPALPFWLITSLSSLALRFKPMILNNSHNLNRESRLLLETLDSRMIKEVIHELRGNGKFNLVDISTGDGTEVKISIL